MNYPQGQLLVTLREVQGFLDRNGAIVGSATARARVALDDVVTALSTHADAQATGSMSRKGETARRKTLMAALRRDRMSPIAQVAAQKLRDVPEFHALRMPANNATATQLVAHAAAMADAARAHEQVFKDAGLPDDFIAHMTAAADKITQSMSNGKKHFSSRSGATPGLKAEDKRGRGSLRILNSLVVPLLRTNDALLGEWKRAKKVQTKPGPVAASPITPTPTPPAAPPAPPANGSGGTVQ